MAKPIKVAVVGVGNCANSLVQGLQYYKSIEPRAKERCGLIHNAIAGYVPRDIRIVAAFDVNRKKIGLPLEKAIWAPPNNAKEFTKVPKTNVIVQPGVNLDGIAPELQGLISIKEGSRKSIIAALQASKAEMLVSYLPVGSHAATRFYAEVCLEVGIAFINAMPEFIASDPAWGERFRLAGMPCAGDDVMSQMGATIVNMDLVGLAVERGCANIMSVQTNVGGNLDFLNMMISKERVQTKKISKTERLGSLIGKETDRVTAGPADYNPYLRDNKLACIIIRGEHFDGSPFELMTYLSVQDSPNSAAVIFDMIRLMRVTLERGLSGPQEWSTYYCKHPPGWNDDEDIVERWIKWRDARRVVEDFVAGK